MYQCIENDMTGLPSLKTTLLGSPVILFLNSKEGKYVKEGHYHSHLDIVSRGKNKSIIAAAAYRSGSTLYEERKKRWHNFSRKPGVVYTEIMLPPNAPREYLNRQTLWMAVDRAEKRDDAQTARYLEFALSNKLTRKEQIAFVRSYVNDNFISKGMCCDFCLHDLGGGRPHVHLLLTLREVSRNGFDKLKNRKWNQRKYATIWRADLAERMNREFRRMGLPDRVSHLSFKDLSIDREPTIYLGKRVRVLEKRGIIVDRVVKNKEITWRNIEKQRGHERQREIERDRTYTRLR